MYQTALLLLTGSLRVVAQSINHYLNFANKKVAKCLYVKLEPELCRRFSKSDTVFIGQLSSLIPIVYSKASTICRNKDVRVILTNSIHANFGNNIRLNFDAVLTNSNEDNDINQYVEENFNNRCFDIVKFESTDFLASTENFPSPVTEFKVFKTVALGGTFDRLHNGHKVLLSEGALRATEKLIVGVSDVNMLKRKILFELIEPVEKRIAAVTNFLLEMDPSLSYEVVPITDPYGPTIVYPDIDCIVVTTETKIGGDKVNVERQKKDMHELVMVVCDLVENTDHSPDEEEKMSSSTKRMHLLGTSLNNLQCCPTPGKPYYILLKGHPMSGKSFIASRFQALGLPVLGCDDILNAILNKDTELRENLTNKFAVDLVTDGVFDINKFTSLCLKNKEAKEWLIKSVYHKVKSALKQVIEVYSEQGVHTILIKDLTLFEECDLELEIHENWTAIIPETESIKNLIEHYGLTDQEATEAIKSLPSNKLYIDISNIVFCNKWSADTTQKQVNKAWDYLKTRQILK